MSDEGAIAIRAGATPRPVKRHEPPTRHDVAQRGITGVDLCLLFSAPRLLSVLLVAPSFAILFLYRLIGGGEAQL